ncbi:hypothetical protein RD792_000829 [Penstemon davidsonii]|uniref:Uncharacterized protein n=1 Tax=Penstemon davidsonii TaxID=160366 RepID=A0ABR0DLS1_9LAMI|nr:hypothetical protein RD792_000829 [Penstemon davidsonii]
MPFFLSLFVFVAGTSWFIFGLLGKDPFVAIPNGIGCGLGAVQLILYAVYRDNKGQNKKPEVDESLEMEKCNGESHIEKTSKALQSQDDEQV